MLPIKVNIISCATAFVLGAAAATATEYHVAVNGRDANSGSRKAPFRTIQRAADLAQAGDVITVHEGIYRERVNPPRGGASEKKRIVYQAAAGETVVITGAERVKDWAHVRNDTWKVRIPNSFFGNFNPYTNTIHGDWLVRGQWNHSGAVYMNDDWLIETTNREEVLGPANTKGRWLCEVEKDNTVIYAQFKRLDPNTSQVEINVRQTVFSPEVPGVNYLTVRGFKLRRAATNWAPPTAGQIGLITAYWCKGWIIENNVITHSKCAGIALGKYADEWDNRCESAEGYTGTVRRALTNGWNKATVGSHIVRNNDISFCEQNGIVGSLGCAFSTISGNNIHDIRTQQTFWGYEIAGIKLHGAVDVEISGNHIYRTEGGIWLDWMLQGSRLTRNFLHDNRVQDLSFEVDHGPVLVDNNLFLSPERAQIGLAQGCAFVHNLNAWRLWQTDDRDKRQTPFFKPHSTELAGFRDNPRGDTRFLNNLFTTQTDLRPYEKATLPMTMAGNVFLKGSTPSTIETNPLLKPNHDPGIRVIEKADGWYLEISLSKRWRTERRRSVVTTTTLGKAIVPNQAFENTRGSPIRINTDYFGRKRRGNNPFPGPFEHISGGLQQLKVWPVDFRSIRKQ